MRTRYVSSLLPALRTQSLLLLVGLGSSLSACGTYISPILPVSECVALLPEKVTGPTPGAKIPSDRTVGTLAAFGDEQTGQLDKANSDKKAIVDFESRCKARDAELIKAVTKKPWWRFLG